MESEIGKTSTPERVDGLPGWRAFLVLFCVTSLVEAYGVSQTLAFLPRYLEHLKVPQSELASWTGTLASLTFLVGLPLVPLWGVWADKYSRKVVIIRSAIVEAVVFALVAVAQTPLHLAVAFALTGFQLGNTGVMLAALRDAVPVKRLGLVTSVFGACGPIGLAVGPVVGGLMLENGFSYSAMYFLAAGITAFIAVLLTFGYREVRTAPKLMGSVLSLAFGVIGKVLRVRSTRLLFIVFGLGFLSYQVVFPFFALLVKSVYGDRPGLDGAIGWVTGGASLLGAIVSPAGGLLGDRFGFRRILSVSAIGAAISLFLMPLSPDVLTLVVFSVALGAFLSAFVAMVFSLLALETPAEQRSSTLNLIYLPIYFSGFLGPQIGRVLLDQFGFIPLFFVAAVVFASGLLPLLFHRRQRQQPPPASEPSS